MSARGRFITVEGIDGAGKSSHLEFYYERVRAKGGDPVLTREPGGTSPASSCAASCCIRRWTRAPRRSSCSPRAASTCAS